MITSWPAPAKLNLFLYVTGQRRDGYHHLQTLFQFIDYSDILEIIPNNSGKITLLTLLPDVFLENNLIIRAAQTLQRIALIRGNLPLKAGVQITLKKLLPIGGGLGGGSSDAATVLVALNDLWQISLSEEELISIGKKLGDDVPVFIRGRAVFVDGEYFQPVKGLEEKWYLVAYPGVSIFTTNIFHDPELTRNSPRRTLDVLLKLPFHNDCESIARKRFLKVDKLLSWLLQYAPSRLTGTGSCVFAEFNTESEANQILELAPKWITGFVARGLNISPLQRTISRR